MSTRTFCQNRFLAIVLCLAAGCSDMQSWDWFGMNGTPVKPTARARRPSNEPAVTDADRSRTMKNQDDPQARQVDEKVEKYVKSMNNTYDPNYESNDFRAKMRRQSDPNRTARVRQTAAMSREQEAAPRKDDAERTPADKHSPDYPDDTKAPVRRPESPVESSKLEEAAPLETDTPSALVAADKSGTTEPKPSISKGPSVPPDDIEEAPSAAIKPAAKFENPSPSPMEIKPVPNRPPVLGEVKVSAGPAPQVDAATNAEANRPAANATPQPVVDTLKNRLDEQQRLVTKDPNNVEEQLKLRMLYLVEGQDDKALAPSPGMNREIQEIIQAQLKSLIAARSSVQRDPAIWANKQLSAIEDLRTLVRARADLSVPRVALCKAIDGYGRYTPFESTEFSSGKANKVLLYVEVDNFSSEKTASGQYRVLLSMRQSLLSKAGEELWSDKQENIEDLAREHRRDFYLTAMYVIPKTLNPGEYVFKVEIEDVLAGKINSNSVTFKLVP